MSNSEKSGRTYWPIAVVLVVLIVALAICFIIFRIETWPARTAKQATGELERMANQVRAVFIDIAHLQPRVTINNRIYMEQTLPASELAVVSRRIEVEHEFVHTWAGSSKRIRLHGTFIAKAGFDLRQNLSIDIRPDEIIIRLPPAQILGLEQNQIDVLEFQNGFWNRISGEDVQNELSILPQLARQKAVEAQLPTEAERTLEQQLNDRIHVPLPLHLVFSGAMKPD
jgi:Protein of unknown function (DUF4230)